MINPGDFKEREIGDDEIRVIGRRKKDSEPEVKYNRCITLLSRDQQDVALEAYIRKMEEDQRKSRRRKQILWIVVILSLLVIAVAALSGYRQYEERLQAENIGYFESVEYVASPNRVVADSVKLALTPRQSADSAGYTEIRKITVNDIVMTVYIPHNGEMSLHVGAIDRNDTTIIYAAQAADVRADNGGIVGAFVMGGEPLSWGLSKKGYVASINGEVTVGVADNSPLFEQATECGGHFFRQYPLVKDCRIVPCKVRGKAIRRGICERNGEIFMVETMSKESFHDFSQALVDMGVVQAVYLVGSSAAGWAVDANDSVHEFGDKTRYGWRSVPENISYMVWRRR